MENRYVPLSVPLLLAIIVFVALVRVRLADAPLERDEGEYAYAGQLILDGIPPYTLAYNMKFPGTYYAYSAIMGVLGQTPWAIRMGLLLVNAISIFLVFRLSARLLEPAAAAIAAAAFALLSLDRGVMGVYAHATHFALLPALGGLLLLLTALDTSRPRGYVLAGLLAGVSLLMKQQAVFFLVLSVGLTIWDAWTRRRGDWRLALFRSSLVIAGAIAPFAVMAALFAGQGILDKFWFWTFQYARAYVSEIHLADAAGSFGIGFGFASIATRPLWMLAGVGAILLWIVRRPGRTRVTVTALAVASFLSICPGFYFRQHYFILMLPVVALLIGVAMSSLGLIAQQWLKPGLASGAAALLCVAVFGLYVFTERTYLFAMTPRALTWSLYAGNPFHEAIEISRYLEDHSQPGETIGVLGSEPEIYFYSHRRSASGYIYTYSLMEPQPFAARMQEEMIRELETAQPKFLVDVRIPTSWLARPTSDRRILTWTQQFAAACYDVAGVTEIRDDGRVSMVWDDAAATFQPSTTNLVYIYKRRGETPCTVPR